MSELNLSSPWIQFVNKVETLFGADPDIKIVYSEDNLNLCLYVNDSTMLKKSDAIRELLPERVGFGEIVLTISVVPSNPDQEPTFEQKVNAAFAGNSNFLRVTKEQHGILPSFTYGLFKNETVQYYADDLTQYAGYVTTTPAAIAQDLIETPTGFYFSTEVEK